MIVTFEELCELSKYRQAAAVKRWCKSQGISFMLDRNKRPQDYPGRARSFFTRGQIGTYHAESDGAPA